MCMYEEAHNTLYLLQGYSHTSYDVVMWPSLKAGEDSSVDLLLVVILDLLALFVDSLDTSTVEDETSARTTQCLVGCCGDNITVLKWTWMYLLENGNGKRFC